MKFYKNNNLITLNIDPGFDSVKININQNLDIYPDEILDITNSQDWSVEGKGTPTDVTTYTDVSTNKTYLVGTAVKRRLKRATSKSDNIAVSKFLENKEIGWFKTDNFFAAINAAILRTLAKYAQNNEIGFELKDMEKWNIYINISLPHSEYKAKELESIIKDKLSTKKTSIIRFGDTSEELTWSIPEKCISVSSQTIDAFYDLTMDEDGFDNPDFTEEDMLPAIVIDGGYKTIGLALIDVDYTVPTAKSNTDYAMKNCDEETAIKINKLIAEKGGEQKITSADMSNIIKDGINFYINNNKDLISIPAEEIAKIKKDTLMKMADTLLDYIVDPANEYDLPNAKSIIITGGTGAAFHPYLKKRLENNYKKQVYLSNNDYNGQACEPVFSIVNGASKFRMSKLTDEFGTKDFD